METSVGPGVLPPRPPVMPPGLPPPGMPPGMPPGLAANMPPGLAPPGLPPRPPGMPPRPPPNMMASFPRPPGMPPRLPNMPVPPAGIQQQMQAVAAAAAAGAAVGNSGSGQTVRPTTNSIPPDLGPPNMQQPPMLRPAGQQFGNTPVTLTKNTPQTTNFQPHYSQMPTRAAPPASNTTLAKPPIFDKDGQPWLEACSASGKIYFFNARTRETRWSKPETYEESESKKQHNEIADDQNVNQKNSEASDVLESTSPILDKESQESNQDSVVVAAEQPEQEVDDDEGRSSIEEVEMKVSDSEMQTSDHEEESAVNEPADNPQQDINMDDTEPEEKVEQHSSVAALGDGSVPNEDVDMVPEEEGDDSPVRPVCDLNVDELPPVVIQQKVTFDEDDEAEDESEERDGEKQEKRKRKQKRRQRKSTKGEESTLVNNAEKMNTLLALSQQGLSSTDEEGSSGDEGNSTGDIKQKGKAGDEEFQDEGQEKEDTNERSPMQVSMEEPQRNDPRPPFPRQAFPPPMHGFGPPPSGPRGIPTNMAVPPPFGMPPHIMRPPPGIPPPGFPGFPPRMPPGQFTPARGFAPFTPFRIPPPEFVPKTIGEWTEHRLPDGRLYYYNNHTKLSKWDKPTEFIEVSNETKIDVNVEEKDEEDKGPPKKVIGKETVEEKKEQGGKGEDTKGAKPVASRPIVGTGWHLVWTGDGKVFFFNPTSKTSIWERPKELENNDRVDEILKQGPKGKGKQSSPQPAKEEPAVAAVVVAEKLDPNASANEKLEEKKNKEPEMKKKKVESGGEGLISSLPIVSNDKHQANERKDNDAAKEMEVRKAIIPLDERMTMFTNLLKEKEVSAFSTWDKELHKILFDPRYLLLTMRERKQCYEKYVKVRAVEERKERIQKLKERKEDFKKLLEEVIGNARTTFSDFAAKNSKDTRFKAIDKMKDRETLFNEFMTDFRKHEKERLKARDDKLRGVFFELLGELSELDAKSQWKKVKSSIETDRRYEMIGSSAKREQFFIEYIHQLEEEKVGTPPPPAPPPPAQEEDEKTEVVRPPSPEGDPESADRNERINASIRKREEEVRAQKEVYEKDREKEREHHQYEKAVQHFKALLADMVKDTQYSWKETRRSLRKDPRWSAVDSLDKTEKEDLFDEHIKDIRDKRKKSFRKLLDDNDMGLDAEWREMRRKVKDDPRYIKFGATESREEEFDAYVKEKTTIARAEFRDLLQECKLITYKSKKTLEENPNHLKDIAAILKKDKRYLTMSALEKERDRLINNYIEELHKRGPPPPPTATNPNTRYSSSKKDAL